MTDSEPTTIIRKPKKTYTIKTYEELRKFFKAFNDGYLNFVIVKSRGGLGKTWHAEKMIDTRNSLWVNGHATPLSVYMKLAEQPSRTIFDDIDTLMANKTIVSLLKQICDTKEEKTVRYYSTAKVNGWEIPPEIKTTTKVLLICNKLNSGDENMEALLTRALVVDFEPTNFEVYAEIMKVYKERVVLDYVKQLLPIAQDLNFRVVKVALEMLKAKLDWQGYVRTELNVDEKINSALTMTLDEYTKSVGSRSDYYKHRQKFKVLNGGEPDGV